MRTRRHFSLFGLGGLALSVIASSLWATADSGQPDAAAFDALTRAVATCPSSAADVALAFERSAGDPSSAELDALTRSARSCVNGPAEFGEQAQLRASIGALQAVLAAHTQGALAVSEREAVATQLIEDWGLVPPPEFY